MSFSFRSSIRGPSLGIHTLNVTQWIPPETVSSNEKKSNFCNFGLGLDKKMGNFLEAKPYYHLHETSFLGWKWSPGMP